MLFLRVIGRVLPYESYAEHKLDVKIDAWSHFR